MKTMSATPLRMKLLYQKFTEPSFGLTQVIGVRPSAGSNQAVAKIAFFGCYAEN